MQAILNLSTVTLNIIKKLSSQLETLILVHHNHREKVSICYCEISILINKKRQLRCEKMSKKRRFFNMSQNYIN